MSTTVTMPQLGETVTEGTILAWAKKVGEEVSEDEVLVEISTDKVDTEVPSPAAGVVLQILVPEGETVPVGTALCVIGEAGEEPAVEPAAEIVEPPTEEVVPEPSAEPAPVAAATAEEPASLPAVVAPVAEEPWAITQVPGAAAPPAEGDGKRKFLSPVVRKLAQEHQLDLALIPGTGAGGRITRKDVEAYLSSPPAATPAAVKTPTPAQPELTIEPTEIPLLSGDEVLELDRMRVRIAENMARARRTAAHVWTSVEVDFERIERVRQNHREGFKAAEGFSLTYLPFIARATVDALKAFPAVNSSIYPDQKKAVFHQAINLGIAVDLNQEGLVVTTVRNADSLRLVGLARSIRELAQRALDGGLQPDDVTGSTFTITNPGPFGSFVSAPIINVPNTAILSTDTVVKRPAVVTSPDGQDTIAIRHIGYLGFSWDHRAFDGSTATLFVRNVKESLEDRDWEQELA